MAHHKPKTKIDTCGREVRLCRDRKASRPSLTKGFHFSVLPDPDPDGAPPPTSWVLTHYPMERRRRRNRAEYKRIERRQLLTREERAAFEREA